MSNANLLNSIQLTKPKNNVFDLSHDVKLSANMGELVPTMALECVPGDRFTIGCESLLRFAPLVSPVMHRMNVTMHYFFVPNRLLWPNWEKFITNTPLAGGALPAAPYLQCQTGAEYTRLHDYMGIPTPTAGNIETISALPFAAYQKIYNDYYRDQNLIPDIADQIELVDGFNSVFVKPELVVLRKRAWEHDYFTSALPFAQKGAAVRLPINDAQVFRNHTSSPLFGTEYTGTNLPSGTPVTLDIANKPTNNPTLIAPDSLYSDGQQAGTNLNDFRRAMRLQEWLEKAARAGSRYVENILAFFGVRSSDKRLQRPEYIVGTKSPVVISEVLNTTGTATAAQGDMAGHAISVTNGKHGAYFCEEHGYIIGIMSVLPLTCYQQGIARHFFKTSDPFQYFWPQFANIGEQEIQRKELYAFQGAAGEQTFGYVPRYAEYKYMDSRVCGDFRNTLDFWHLGRKFATPPLLNQAFIECDPTHRVFAVTSPTVQKLYCHIYHQIKAVRPMPKFGTPSM